MGKPSVDTHKLYAVTGFTVDDVLTLRPKWTDEECAAWLQKHESDIRAEQLQAGYESMENILRVEDSIQAAAKKGRGHK